MPEMFTKLRILALLRGRLLPLGVAVALLALGHCARLLPPRAGLILLAVTGGLFLAAFLLFLCRSRKLSETAAWFDAVRKTRNEFESAFELSDTDHPLRDAQRSAAEARWRSAGRHALLLPLLTFLMLLAVGTGLLTADIRLAKRLLATPPSAGESAGLATTTASPEIPRPPVQATIEITAPEAEAEFKPIDPVEYEGRATTTAAAGFTALTLHVSVNGGTEHAAPFDVAALARDGGTVFFDGLVLPDEFGGDVFDLLTLRVTGTLPDGRHVSSAPRTFRLKPLRNEIAIIEGGDMPFQDLYDLIRMYLQRQLKLNELYYLGRNALELDPAPDLEGFRLLEAEQQKLGEELAAFRQRELEKTDTTAILTVTMAEELARAVEAMHEAVAGLKRAPDKTGLAPVPAAQQRAAAHLSRAIRELQRAIPRKPKPAPNSEDKSAKKPEFSAAKLLTQAIADENAVLLKLPQPGEAVPPEVAKPQGAVSWALRLLVEHTELPDPVLAALKTALPASTQAEAAITSNAPEALRFQAKAALEAMQQALRLLKEREGNAIAEARRQVAKLESEARAKGGAPVGDAPADALTKAAAELAQTCPADGTGGELAKKMADTAKNIRGKTGSDAARELQKLRQAFNDATGGELGNDPGKLAEKFGELARELDYLKKHPGDTEQFDAWRDEVQRTLHAAAMRRDPQRVLQEAAGQVMDLGPDPNPAHPLLDKLAANLKIIADAFAREAAAKRLPPPGFAHSPDRIPAEYRDASARYFEALSKLKLPEEAADGTR